MHRFDWALSWPQVEGRARRRPWTRQPGLAVIGAKPAEFAPSRDSPCL